MVIDKLKKYLIDNNISVEELADALGIPAAELAAKLDGESETDLAQLAIICNHLGASIDMFFDDMSE